MTVLMGYGLLLPGLLAVVATPQQVTLSESLGAMSSLSETVTILTVPEVELPQWLKDAEAAQAKQQSTRGTTVVTYDVATRGVLTADMNEFKRQAHETLNDVRGWSRLGVTFQEVATGGMFTLALSEASQVPSFAAPGGCSAEYSCRVGRYVIINQTPWLQATPSWNSAGGTLRDYRHMVINHETGHWLGHGHETECSSEGKAQVMQQQSINLHGCVFNPWPVASELWSTQLGIQR